MSLIDDAVLLKMAEAEILGEAKRAAARHAIVGVSGWQKCSKPNKTFLTNTLLQTMASNRILARKKDKKLSASKKSERKLLKRSKSDKSANFIYKKPANTGDKLNPNTKSGKPLRNESATEDKMSETRKKSVNCNAKKVKIKKT